MALNPTLSLLEGMDLTPILSGQYAHMQDKIIDSHTITWGHDKQRMADKEEVAFFHVKQLSFDEDYPHREAFENVLLSLDNIAFNLVYILSGDEDGINLYIGVVKNANENKKHGGKMLTANDYGRIVAGAFTGNFGGSVIEKIKGDDLEKRIFNLWKDYKETGIIVGIPSVNTKKQDTEKGFQGIERLINSMLGTKWRLIVVAEPVGKAEILDWQQEIYKIFNIISPLAKGSIQQSANKGMSSTTGDSHQRSQTAGYSKSRGKSGGSSHTNSNGSGSSNGTSTGWSQNDSHNESKSITDGTNSSMTDSSGSSNSFTTEIANKHVQETLKYIDEQLLERVKSGFSRGLFKTSVYYMADTPVNAGCLKRGIMSLFQGDESTYSPLIAYDVILDNNKASMLNVFQNNYIDNKSLNISHLALLSRPHHKQEEWLSTYLTADEVSLLAGLPQKEIPGIPVIEGVDFGLNVNPGGEIELGHLVQKGRKLENMPFRLNTDFLQKHTFIAGVTGSGKTTTCHKLLQAVAGKGKTHFLVIEPAKTEYRTLINSEVFKDKVIVFTVGDEETAPLRFNPFELVAGEKLSSHVDMLKATFTTAFPMEGSMPQIIEEAIYKCYEDKGWDSDTSRNLVCAQEKGYQDGDEFKGKYEGIFPTLSDFLSSMTSVVEGKNFDRRLRDDYIGTLVSRFSNLRKGSKGRMLNTSLSIDFCKLVDQNVIFELESLKAPEDKALIMGLILARLSAVIQEKHKQDKDFRHITLVEEAHRLLSKVEYGDTGSKKGAVETFTDLLAEVRKYGEGLIIVDQIPNKLAPETIKNTNTKIIHKLFARDDKETVGDTMLMDDKQKAFLSALNPGEAIVFSEGVKKPVHIAIKRTTDTNGAEVPNDTVKKTFKKYIRDNRLQMLYLQSKIVEQFSNQFNSVLEDLARKIICTQGTPVVSAAFKRAVKEYIRSESLDENDIYDALVQERAVQSLMSTSMKNLLKEVVSKYFCGKEGGINDIQIAIIARELMPKKKK